VFINTVKLVNLLCCEFINTLPLLDSKIKYMALPAILTTFCSAELIFVVSITPNGAAYFRVTGSLKFSRFFWPMLLCMTKILASMVVSNMLLMLAY